MDYIKHLYSNGRYQEIINYYNSKITQNIFNNNDLFNFYNIISIAYHYLKQYNNSILLLKKMNFLHHSEITDYYISKNYLRLNKFNYNIDSYNYAKEALNNSIPGSDIYNAANKLLIFLIIIKRNITKLIHFTPISNVTSIINNGLLSHTHLEKNNIDFTITDPSRHDNIDGVCLSISFPNYKMRYYKETQEGFHFAMIIINPAILYSKECYFYAENASETHNQNTKPFLYTNLENMFSEKYDKINRSLDLEDCYPTNPQAEVICIEPITNNDIMEIQCCRYSSDYEYLKSFKIKKLKHNTNFYYPRSDYQNW